MTNNKYIECGKIINTHGCKGGVKLESWCNTPEELADMERIFLVSNGKYTEYKIKKSSLFKQFVLFDLDGINDMDSALMLKNKTVYASRDDFELEDGEYFIADIIGLDAIDANSGKIYGKVKDMINRGASDLYVIETASGEAMIPAVDEFIDRVELDKGLYIRPIEGMFDDAEEI